ncbi:hypothetical protein B9Z55_023694 [Caenorhabditis nigoni]|uniref:Uncharacterized protein n=1 Tax=Caenorhabditis nigoni TaxID=1611254 RepID=A0A2G5SQV2_9PELO|nr:hypothetical protein B9Z55_023694 [Caenorhabditis nigoni]
MQYISSRCATITLAKSRSTRDVKEVVFFEEEEKILDRWVLEERMQKRTDKEKSMLSEEELKLDGSKIVELLKPFEMQLHGCDGKKLPRKKKINIRSPWPSIMEINARWRKDLCFKCFLSFIFEL